MPMKHLLPIVFLTTVSICKGQGSDANLFVKCKERALEYFTTGADSSTIAKHLQFDLSKSSYVNRTKNIYLPISQIKDSSNVDGIQLAYVLLYKGDTLRNIYCEFDTACHLINRLPHPSSFRPLIEPYLALFKGKLAFDYKKLMVKLKAIDLQPSHVKSIELLHRPVIDRTKTIGKYYSTKSQYYWVIFTDCPESKCRQLEISATTGQILADDLVKMH